MLVLVASELAALYLSFSLFKVVAIASLVTIFLVAWRQLKLRELYLIGIWAAGSNTVSAIVRPIIDTLQIMPLLDSQ